MSASGIKPRTIVKTSSIPATERFFKLSLILIIGFSFGDIAQSATSPYVTSRTNVPLDQAVDDSINGVLPYFASHTPQEGGSVASLTDAISPTAPTGNVILGPDNTWLGVAWDFGEPAPGMIWKLDRMDIWIAAADNLRKGYRADLSVSVSGDVNDFQIIPNSYHWEGLTENSQFNHIRYDFPDEFIEAVNEHGEPIPDQHKYPVTGFRYLRFNSRGDGINGVDWQPRYVEIDVWVSQVSGPSDVPVIESYERDESGNVHLAWSAVPGRTYAVERTEALTESWTTLDYVYAEGTTASFSDFSPPQSQGFYRVVWYGW